MFCDSHKERIAISACMKCGKGVCAECQTVIQGQYWCKSCSSTYVPAFYITLNFRNPWVAAISSLIIPGIGQVYNGQVFKGIIVFLSAWLIVPWIYGVVDAFVCAKRINQGKISSTPKIGYLIGCLGLVFVLAISPVVLVKTFQYYSLVSQINAQESFAINTLLKISEAAESYAKVYGQYPEQYSDLYFAQPPYLNELYCDVSMAGGRYSCVFSKKGYVVTVKPEPEGLFKKTFSITTGGVLLPFEQKEIPEEKPLSEKKTGS